MALPPYPHNDKCPEHKNMCIYIYIYIHTHTLARIFVQGGRLIIEGGIQLNFFPEYTTKLNVLI